MPIHIEINGQTYVDFIERRRRVDDLLDWVPAWTVKKLIVNKDCMVNEGYNYSPPDEKENGYLGAAVEETGYLEAAMWTRVFVRRDSRSPPDATTMYQCDYVYACLAEVLFDPSIKYSRGWVPLDILQPEHLHSEQAMQDSVSDWWHLLDGISTWTAHELIV